MSDSFFSFWRNDLNGQLTATRESSSHSAEPQRWLVGWGALSLLLLLGLYFSGGYHTAFVPINNLGQHLPEFVWQWLTVLGDERVVIALMLPVARRRPDVFWAFFLTLLAALLITHSIKPFINANRPPAVLSADLFNLIGPSHDRHSFPSGHSLAIGAFVGVWLWFVRSWKLRIGLILIGYVIAGSRVVVGVHWPVDVMAGLLGGSIAVWIGARLSLIWQGGFSPAAHMFVLVFCMLYASTLLVDDGGYHQAKWLMQGIIWFGLISILNEYLLEPYRRWQNREQHLLLQLYRSDSIWMQAIRQRPELFLLLLLQFLFFGFPQIDTTVTGWFYSEVSGFYLGDNPLVQFSYHLFAKLHFYVLPLLFLALAWTLLTKAKTKPVAFLLVTLVLGPGLLVNEVIKADSGRARPMHTEVFGGDKQFTPAFQPANQCDKNCSFVSGHAAMGFWFLTLAWVTRRRGWLYLGIGLGAMVGLGRMVQGAHFFSDVIFAFWTVYFTSLILARLFFGTTQITGSDRSN